MSHESNLPSLTRFLMFPLSAIGGSIVLIALADRFAPAWRIAAILAVGYAWYCVGGCLHELIHQTLTANRRLNLILGRIIGTLTFTPYRSYLETHLTHHARLNTKDDWELWPYCDPEWPRAARIIYFWTDIIFALPMIPFQYCRIGFSRRSPLSPDVKQFVRRETYAAAIFWLTVFSLGCAIVQAGYASGSHLLLFGIGPLWVGSVFNKLRMAIEHFGLSSFDPLLGTRTIVGGNWLTRLTVYFNFDISIHGPHHRSPKIRHGALERKWAECVKSRPEVARLQFRSYASALWDVLPSLLINPAVGVNVAGNSGTMESQSESAPPQNLAA